MLLRDKTEGDLISIYRCNSNAVRPYYLTPPADMKDPKEIELNRVDVLNIQLKESYYKIVP